MALKYDKLGSPSETLLGVLEKSDARTVHMMGRELEKAYSKDACVALDRWLADQKWPNGLMVTTLVCVLGMQLHDMGGKVGMRESFLVAMIAHMYAFADDMDEKNGRKNQPPPESQIMYFLFPSSEHATNFAKRAVAMLGDIGPDSVEAKAVGPFARIVSKLCENQMFVQDMRLAAEQFGGEAVSKSRTSWEQH